VIHHGYYPARAPLDGLVEFFWAADAYVAEAPRERVLPTGAHAIVIHLAAAPMRIYASEDANAPASAVHAVLCGARSSPLIIGTEMGPTVGIHFKPGGARPFFDVPADATTGQAVSLEDVWGPSSRALRERLLAAPTAAARVGILEAALLARARRPLELSPALRAALGAFEDPALPSVAEVNRRTGLSPKRLAALFHDEIGLGPKAFWRVRRFRAALRDLDHGVRGAALAHEHGYFDQAHFLREFRALAGSSPRDYLAARVAGSDHVSVRG
jgi:AraC-like DNA-binding protein